MPPTFLEKGIHDQYKALVDGFDTWLFDCDGVLWNGDTPVDGAKEVLEMLRRQSATEVSCSSDVRVLILLWGHRQIDYIRDEQRYQVEKDLQGKV